MNGFEHDTWEPADVEPDDPPDPAVARVIIAVAVLLLLAAVFIASPLPARMHALFVRPASPMAAPAQRPVWG